MSKPAMTPEMVEKAAGELEDTLHDLSGVHFDMLMDEAIKHKLQSFAASAVQDAVRECCRMMCKFCKAAESGDVNVSAESEGWHTIHRGNDHWTQLCAVAALREKYGVKP